MKDQYKTRKQLLEELEVLRKQLANLKKAETKRKRVEEALKESEQRFRTTFEGAIDGILLADIETKKFYTGNKTICKMLGYSLKEIKNLSVTDIHPKEALSFVLKQFDRLARGEIAKTSDLPVKRKDGSVFYAEISTVRLNLDTGPYLMGTFRDITERKQAEEELRESEERYRSLFENSDDAVLLTVPDGTILQANPSACRMFGRTEAEMIQMGRNGLVDTTDSRLPIALEERKRTGKFRGELTFLRRDGQPFPAELTSVVFQGQGGQPRSSMIIRDITERKQAEEALRESEAILRALINAPTDSVLLLDSRGVILDLNKIAAERLGKSKDELIGTLADDSLPEDIAKKRRSFISQIFETKREVRFEDERDGIWYDTVAYPITDKDGVVGRLAIIARDITYRKRAEAALRQREERYRRLVDNSLMGIGISCGNQIVFANPALLRLFGYENLEEFKKIPLLNHVAPASRERIAARMEKVARGDPVPVEFEYEILCKGGLTKTLLASSQHFTLDGKTYSQTTFQDITERKRAEEALRESEERMKSIFRAAPIGIGVVTNRVLLDVNTRICEMTGYSREELVRSSARVLYPTQDDFDYVGREKYGQIAEKGTGSVETRWMKKDGTIIDVLLSSSPIDPSDLSHGVTFTVLDITESKQGEKALRESEERFRLAFENANTGVCLVDLDGNLTRVNNKMCEIFGYTKEELERMTVNDIAHPEDIDKSPEFIQKTLRGEIDRSMFEKRYFHKKGHVVTCQVSSSLVRDAAGTRLYFISHVHDISDRKQAEAQIRESQQRFQGLVETLSDWIWEVDQNGIYTYVSPKVKDLLGFEPEKILGKTPFDLMPPEEAERVKGIFETLLAARQPLVALENVSRHKDGRLVVFETSGAPFFDAQGQLMGYRGVDRDITERKKTEEALKERQETINAIVETSQEWIWAIDSQGVHTYSNPAIEKILGYRLEEIVGSLSLDLIHEDDKKKVESTLQECKEKRCGWNNFLLRWRHKDGTYRYLESNAVPILNSKGDLVGFRGVDRDITEYQLVESERLSNLHFFESLDKVNRAMQATNDLEQMMGDVLGTILSVFNCDRAFLLYPCDPEVPAWTVPMERTRPDYPGAIQLGRPIPMTKPVQMLFQSLLATGGTVELNLGKEINPEDEPWKQFQIKSVLAIALHPMLGKPWEFGLHQCSYGRAWTIQEKKLFQEISRRLTYGLTSLLVHRNMKNSEEFLNKIVENIPNMLFVKDAETLEFVRFNRAGEQLLGYSKEELLGKSDYDFFSEEQADFFAAKDHKVLSTKNLIDISEEIIRNKNNEERILHTKKIPILDEAGKPKYLLSISEDITERRRAEEALRQSEERYRSILENTEEGYYEVDLAGKFIFFNDSLCRIYGYPREELMGMNNRQYMDQKTAKKLFEAFNQAFQTGEPGRVFDYEIIRKDGTKRYVEASISLQKDSSGRPTGFRGITRDVTERKHAEEALRKEKEISLSILENAPYGVVLIDTDGKYIYINPEFTNITGYTLQDIPTGKDWFQKVFSDPKDRERMIQLWKKDRSKGNMINRDFSINRKDGKTNEIETRSTFLRDGRAVMVLHDIAEQKRAEAEMRSLQEQLRQSQKMEAIGRLAGGIAHDFNNLLTIIKGYSQLSLIELKEDTPLRGNIEHIHTATDRAADLVRQLLAFSRRQILEMKVWDLNTILTNLHNMLRRLIGEDIELTTILGKDLGRVKTDLGWIEQAIMNLVVNARDAMPSGGKLTIETGNAVLDEAYVSGRVGVKPGRYVVLSVSDTGVGMIPEVRERLFEPFFSTKEKDKGTGLGLSTVYGIVKQSDGDIWVYTEPGKGSTFKIYLPRVDAPPEQPREKVSGDELLRGSETILLVEDEEEVRKLAIRVLERQGYKVLEAHDGDEALLVCEQHQGPIHLMLTDVVMPGMNGHELAKRLEPFHPEMKVLYMSGYTDNAIVLHGVLVEGVHYIQKPFTVNALAKKVREVLEQ